MANKSFGIKELNLIGSSGAPVIESPTSLSVYATTVAISTNVTIGGILDSSLYIGNNHNVGLGTTTTPGKFTIYNGDISFTGTSAGNINLPNASRLTLGNNGISDSSLLFDGSDLRIECSNKTRFFDGFYDYLTIQSGAGVGLYYGSGSKKLETIDTGVLITGNLSVSGIVSTTTILGSGSALTGIVTGILAGSNISIGSSTGLITINASSDTQWQSTAVGINTLVNVGVGTTNPTSKFTVLGNSLFNGTVNSLGGLSITGVTTITSGRIQFSSGDNIRFGNIAGFTNGGSNNIAIGDQALYTLNGGSGRNISLGSLSLYDTTSGQYNIALGDRSGQKITTGSYNVLIGSYDGQTGLDLRTSSNNVVISDGQGNIRQYINSSGNVGIKTTIITEALTVAGIVSATSFYGTLNASQLTGALPAIDGSSLFGVVATGTGIEVRDDGVVVGTARTVDFGSNLSISFGSGIATVTGSGLATYATTSGVSTYATTSGVSSISSYANIAGVSTYATTAGLSTYSTSSGIASALISTANIDTTGIITASSYNGSGSGLTNIPAGQLTGTLPALDGSNLLNVNATGDGIVVLDNGTNVGSAKTINFGTGLDVQFTASGIATVISSGGSLQSRTTVIGITTSITNNGIGNTDITGFKSYALMKVGLSTAGWIRIYTDSTSRAADASRSIGIDPAPGSGVIAEVITTGISTTQIISPFVMGGNLNSPADTTIYAAITNLSGSTQTITANLTILQLEA